MSQADEHTLATLRKLKQSGKLSSKDGIDDETARELLKTPPSSSLLSKTGGSGKGGESAAAAVPPLDGGGASYSSGASAGLGSAPIQNSSETTIAVLAKHMEDDVTAFSSALEDNTRLAKEQMQRSLLQLFEDTAREKLADTFLRGSAGVAQAGGGVPAGNAQGGAGSFRAGSGAAAVRSKMQSPLGAVGGLRTVSRRPVDRGLDKRDAPSDLVIPEAIREQISQDIFTVVDHELKRWLNVITSDTDRILQHALGVRDRMTKMEEEVLQRQVENRMQADQLTQYAAESKELNDELLELRDHNHDKDQQMDILRDQVGRRNQSLDETRVRFRKEVMRYKARQYELEMELENLTNKHHSRSKGGAGGMERKMSLTDFGAEGDPEAKEEMLAAAEVAVKETTDRFNEEIKQIHIRYAKEKKAILAEMRAKITERDDEILRLRKRLQDKQPGEEDE